MEICKYCIQLLVMVSFREICKDRKKNVLNFCTYVQDRYVSLTPENKWKILYVVVLSNAQKRGNQLQVLPISSVFVISYFQDYGSNLYPAELMLNDLWPVDQCSIRVKSIYYSCIQAESKNDLDKCDIYGCNSHGKMIAATNVFRTRHINEHRCTRMHGYIKFVFI